MSRTKKDKPSKLKYGSWDQDMLIMNEPYRWTWLQLPTTKTKKRKEVDSEWHWMRGTPSWWNNLFHTRPIRGKFRNFCSNARKTDVSQLEELLEPKDSKSPHKYFW